MTGVTLPGEEAAPAAPPGASAAPSPVEASTHPTVGRARARVVLLLVALVVWFLPWHADERGPARTGAPTTLAFAAALTLAATALLARTRRGLLVGEALASAAVAIVTTGLVMGAHPWLPGPDRSATCLPIFGPLTALALLDAVSRLRRPPLGAEVATIRAVAATLCAGALFVAMDPLPAVVAAWLALAPLAVASPKTARGARRGLEVLSTLAAVALLLGRDAHRLLVRGTEAGEDSVWPFVFSLVGFALVVLAGRGVLFPEPRDDA
jgi:hypothetical protein